MPTVGAAVRPLVEQALHEVAVTDIHTHLYPAGWSGLLLRGPDELLTYHYLVAEALRASQLPPEHFWSMSKREQADFVWQELFVRRSPLSEACRGVLTTWQRLGIDVDLRSGALEEVRQWAARLPEDEYVDRVLRAANVRQIVMTNDPFDPTERQAWQAAGNRQGSPDPRFLTALRVDPLFTRWASAVATLTQLGYACEVAVPLRTKTVSQLQRFLDDWIARLHPVYLAASLPPEFRFEPEPSGHDVTLSSEMMSRVLIPAARTHRLPFALMIGVRRQVNPALRSAGDGVGRAAVEVVEALCRAYPDVHFLATFLSRENQHELVVAARKFANLLPFGCWWFLNNPSLVGEITRMRLEMLGTTFVAQHSDARVLDQLVYKWAHTRTVLAQVLTQQYEQLAAVGWTATAAEVRRDVAELLGGSFWRFVNPAEAAPIATS